MEITATVVDIAPPTVQLTNPNGGEIWYSGMHQNVTWTASDNAGVTSVDLQLSMDGGLNYTEIIATGLPNTGTYDWVVSPTPTEFARVRAVAHDAAANSSSDASDADFIIVTNLSGIADNLLAAGEVLGVYPNPGMPGNAHVLYRMAKAGTVTVSIYDISGRLIRRLGNEFFGGGLQTLKWDGTDENGQVVATGIYLVRLTSSSGAHATKRMVFFQN
jgi:hypothetical protein